VPADWTAPLIVLKARAAVGTDPAVAGPGKRRRVHLEAAR
jgi:hypothetical protein